MNQQFIKHKNEDVSDVGKMSYLVSLSRSKNFSSYGCFIKIAWCQHNREIYDIVEQDVCGLVAVGIESQQYGKLLKIVPAFL